MRKFLSQRADPPLNIGENKILMDSQNDFREIGVGWGGEYTIKGGMVSGINFVK